MEGIKGKNVLITGASGGIGKSIAEKFSEEGANIGIHYFKNEKDAKKLYENLSQKVNIKLYKSNFLAHKLDLVKRFINDFGGIDILVNNAGVIDSKSFLEMDEKDYDYIFKINSKAPFIFSKDAFNDMKKNKFGRIINISSFVVKYGKGRNDSIQYAASKATLEVLTKGLASIGAKYNILVNSIRPGIINTRLNTSRKDLDERINKTPLKRMGKVEDISNMVIYLASDKGNFITGEIITIGGGE